MYRLADMGLVWVPVELPQAPMEPGAEPELVTVHLRMKLLDGDELAARDRDTLLRTTEGLMQEIGKARTSAEVMEVFDRALAIKRDDRDELCERISDWHGFGSGDEAEEFSDDKLAALLRHDHVFSPVRLALFKASREGVRKN
jgi:hypothetical protein